MAKTLLPLSDMALTDDDKDIIVAAVCELLERHRKAKDWHKAIAIAAAGAKLSLLWATEEAAVEQPWEPQFRDCALPRACECAKRVKPEWEHSRCLVPTINKAADDLGWQRPYPGVADGP